MRIPLGNLASNLRTYSMSTQSNHHSSSTDSDLQQSSPPNYPFYLLLPPELLLEIFARFCYPHRSLPSRSNVTRIILPAPLLLGKICRHWRQLVFSSPSLWTYIYLIPWIGKINVQAPLLEDYLCRSKGLPLTIVIRKKYVNSPYVHWDHDGSLPLYKLITRESRRWEIIDVFDPDFFAISMNQIRPHLPLLHTVSLETSKPGLLASFVQDAPQLRNLALNFFTLPKSVEMSPLHLTHLRASTLNEDEVLNVLKNALNLRSCFLTDVAKSRPGDLAASPAARVHLKCLESFTIQNSSGTDLLLRNIISTPVLREFRYAARQSAYPPLGLVKHLLHRSHCQLETLELETTKFRIQDLTVLLEPLLRQVDTLTKLALRPGVLYMADEFAEGIAKILNPLWPPASPVYTSMLGSSQSPVILPHLQHFEMEFMGGPFLPILKMLKQRWLFGDAASSDSSPAQDTRKCSRIVSARFPEWSRPAVMLHLGDEIKAGMVVDFIPKSPKI